MKDPKVIAERIAAAAGEHSGAKGGVRSPLYVMFWDQYDALAPALNPPRTPNWEAVAREAAAAGVLAGKGRQPNAVTAQKTWAKVVRDKARATGAVVPRTRRRKAEAAGGDGSVHAAAPAAPAPSGNTAGGTGPTPGLASMPDLPDDDDEIVPQYAGGRRTWNKGETNG